MLPTRSTDPACSIEWEEEFAKQFSHILAKFSSVWPNVFISVTGSIPWIYRQHIPLRLNLSSYLRGWWRRGNQIFALVSFAYPLFPGSIVGCFVDPLTDMAGNREVLAKKLHKQGFYTCAAFAKDCMGKINQKRFLPNYLGIGPISV